MSPYPNPVYAHRSAGSAKNCLCYPHMSPYLNPQTRTPPDFFIKSKPSRTGLSCNAKLLTLSPYKPLSKPPYVPT